MTWFLLVVLILVVVGVLWFLNSRSGGQTTRSRLDTSVPPSRRSTGGTSSLGGATGAVASHPGDSSSLASSAGSTALPMWNDPQSENDPALHAHVSWQQDAQDEDALMTPEQPPHGGEISAADRSEAIGDPLAIDEPEATARSTDEPAGAEAAGGDPAATADEVPRFDGGAAPVDPVEATSGADAAGAEASAGPSGEDWPTQVPDPSTSDEARNEYADVAEPTEINIPERDADEDQPQGR